MIVNDYGDLVLSGKTKTIGERVEAIGDHLTKVDDQMQAGDKRMTRIEGNVAKLRGELAANTKATKQLEENTKEIVEFFRAVQGALKVLNWLARVAKPLGYIAGAVSAAIGLWAAWKGKGQ